ncbi:hypothetical protein, partial [Paenibacillus alginolyticus]
MNSLKRRRLLKGLSIILSAVCIISLLGCAQKTDVKPSENKGSSEAVKKKPDTLTEVKLGLPSKNMSYIPFYVAIKKG